MGVFFESASLYGNIQVFRGGGAYLLMSLPEKSALQLKSDTLR